MGNSYVAIACSLDSLASVYSSRDEALFARVLAADDPQVRHYLDAACRRDGLTSEAVLTDIFRGAALLEHRPHVYAYALLACAYVVGDDLGGFDCAYSRPGKLTARLGELNEPEDVVPLFLDEWPLPDVATGDYPMCTTLAAVDVASIAAGARATLDRVAPSMTGDDDEISLELLTYFTRCYEAAASRGRDLLLVAH